MKSPLDEPLRPTPYADVNLALRDVLASVGAILGDHLVGMYLYGSLALGDFDPRGSDIDAIVVTDAELSDSVFAALRDMHARFDASGSPWARKIEAAYIPRDALRPDDPTAARYPQIEKGGALVLDYLESGWVVQCYILREHGVVVAGPSPHALVAPIDPRDMRRAAAVHADVWAEQARHDPDWLAWVRRRDNQAFVVLTLCRMLYTLDTGTVASKPVATRWAGTALANRWAALIERALSGQHEGGDAPDADVRDAIALVDYTVERSRQRHLPPPPARPR